MFRLLFWVWQNLKRAHSYSLACFYWCSQFGTLTEPSHLTSSAFIITSQCNLAYSAGIRGRSLFLFSQQFSAPQSKQSAQKKRQRNRFSCLFFQNHWRSLKLHCWRWFSNTKIVQGLLQSSLTSSKTTYTKRTENIFEFRYIAL